MDNSECLELKKAKFYPDKIVLLKNKREIIIPAGGIKYISYVRPTFFNFLFDASPWFFTIMMRPNLYGVDRYTLVIKNKNFQKIQQILKVQYSVI